MFFPDALFFSRLQRILFFLFLFNCEFDLLPSHVASQTTTRPFYMGMTPFANDQLPFWDFESLTTVDLVSLHLDDFIGVPWQSFANNGPPPAPWERTISALSTTANAKGVPLYLALSPLTNRKTLATMVDTNGNRIENWAPTTAAGCYAFSSDPYVETYKTAYINYVSYMINLFHPRFVSPAIEINLQFLRCPGEKSAFIAWYKDIHRALKAKYPKVVIFPTFEVQHLYGIVDAATACSMDSSDAALETCFQSRLEDALTVPGDRIAFSFYPFLWKLLGREFPYADMFNRVLTTTTRKIWISETGWPAVPILRSYAYVDEPTTMCGPVIVPEATVANDEELAAHLKSVLQEAQSGRFEAVIWWENWDLLDRISAMTCPCSPRISPTCSLTESMYRTGGEIGEMVFRVFGNMGLIDHNGQPRPAYEIWQATFAKPRKKS